MKLLVLCQNPDGPVVRHRVRAILPHLEGADFDEVRIVGVQNGILSRRAALNRLGLFATRNETAASAQD